MDQKLIQEIEDLGNVVTKLQKLTPIKFKRRDNNKTSIGVVSQEMALQFPELVTRTSTGYYVVDYEKMSVILIAAVQELNKKIMSLEKKYDRRRKK